MFKKVVEVNTNTNRQTKDSLWLQLNKIVKGILVNASGIDFYSKLNHEEVRLGNFEKVGKEYLFIGDKGDGKGEDFKLEY